MKMTRDQLKKIIKECLVEILIEGAGEALTERLVPSQRQVVTQRPSRQTQQQRRPSVYDSTRPQSSPHAIEESVKQITKDPILASILADTAKTTLIDQNSNGRSPAAAGGDQASRVVAAYEPAAIFGEEQTARWAQAAFAPSHHMPGFSSGLDYDPYASVKKA